MATISTSDVQGKEEGYLMSYSARLYKEGENFILPHGTVFHFEPKHVTEAIVVCLVCLFECDDRDWTILSKSKIKAIVDGVKGVGGKVHVSVMVCQEPSDAATGTTKDIQLITFIPPDDKVTVTGKSIMAPVTQYLKQNNYNSIASSFNGTLMSSGLVVLHSSDEHENIKRLREETKFTFFNFENISVGPHASGTFVTESEEEILLNLDRDLELIEKDEYTFETTDDAKMVPGFELIIRLTYYFNVPQSRDISSALQEDPIIRLVTNEMKSSKYQYINLMIGKSEAIPTSTYVWKSSHHYSGSFIPTTTHAWVGLEVKTIDRKNRIPNVYQILSPYFRSIKVKNVLYRVLPQDPQPTR